MPKKLVILNRMQAFQSASTMTHPRNNHVSYRQYSLPVHIIQHSTFIIQHLINGIQDFYNGRNGCTK